MRVDGYIQWKIEIPNYLTFLIQLNQCEGVVEDCRHNVEIIVEHFQVVDSAQINIRDVNFRNVAIQTHLTGRLKEDDHDDDWELNHIIQVQ